MVKRINAHALDPNLEVDVGPCAAAGAAHLADELPTLNVVTYVHPGSFKMTVQGRQATAVINDHCVTVADLGPGCMNDHASARGVDRGPIYAADVNGPVAFRVTLRQLAHDRPGEIITWRRIGLAQEAGQVLASVRDEQLLTGSEPVGLD